MERTTTDGIDYLKSRVEELETELSKARARLARHGVPKVKVSVIEDGQIMETLYFDPRELDLEAYRRGGMLFIRQEILEER